MLNGHLTYISGWLIVLVGIVALARGVLHSSDVMITSGLGVIGYGFSVIGQRRAAQKQIDETKQQKEALERIANLLGDK